MKKYDVVIIGSGIAGCLTGIVLAKHKLSVLLIDAGSHPKFAIGESTVGHTSEMIQLISERFDIPEIGYISSFRKIRDNVTKSCGVKRGFGFIYHNNKGEQLKDEVHQFVVPPLMHGLDSHMYRQDIDSFLFNTAIKYGADHMLNTKIDEIHFEEQSATITLENKTSISCDFVLDGSGYRSLISKKYNLRKESDELHTKSRSIFTHMIDVLPYDDCIPKKYHNMPLPWFQTTLHHMFDGGWMWVIPFNNHRQAVNNVCSVGLTLDIDKYPETGLSASEEFYKIIGKFPSIKKQFKKAKNIRDWVSTPRLQYLSSSSAGHRYFLLPHSAGFVDPLFSRGLAITMDGLFYLIPKILEAFETKDFSVEKFKSVDTIVKNSILCADELVHTSFKSFSDFRLWNAWIRLWAMAETGLDQLRILKAKLKFKNDKDDQHFKDLEDVLYPGFICPDSHTFYKLWKETRKVILDGLESGDIEKAEKQFFKLLNNSELNAPVVRMGDPRKKIFGGSVKKGLQAFYWGKQSPKEELKRYYDIKLSEILKLNFENRKEVSTKDL
ncbi:NAD(P)/FAD-dependent oxidoreductase [Aquimarina sp. RZ0]|uniref:NAD(P)/FAD-dependent oxidoreductase n=1 Tax=Aquimarina sp. RZ0 TaxID=2607730 RepID=UPI0011F39A08|nr:FAD-dependent oxidoreductase [Aquimarina sp. RZ0]KAA1242378.1 FAD-dependent oxidoreductase [Aquimarina sp. RZ0]